MIYRLAESLTYSSRHGYTLPTAHSLKSPARINLSIFLGSQSFSFEVKTTRSAHFIMSVAIAPILLPERKLVSRLFLVVGIMAGVMIPLGDL